MFGIDGGIILNTVIVGRSITGLIMKRMHYAVQFMSVVKRFGEFEKRNCSKASCITLRLMMKIN